MAKIYLDGDGIAIGYAHAMIGPSAEPPHAGVLEFDEETNPVLVAAARNNAPGELTVRNGVPIYKGNPIAVNAESGARVEQRQMMALGLRIVGTEPVTQAELRLAVRALLLRQFPELGATRAGNALRTSPRQ